MNNKNMNTNTDAVEDGNRPKRQDQRRERGAFHPDHPGAVAPKARLLVEESVRGSGRRNRLISRPVFF